MIVKTIPFTNLNGDEKELVAYFHLTEAEIVELELTSQGKAGFQAFLQSLVEEKDGGRLYLILKDFILRSYGKRSADGDSFIKTQALRDEFESSPAFSNLIVGFLTGDPEDFTSFIQALAPASKANPQDHKQAEK